MSSSPITRTPNPPLAPFGSGRGDHDRLHPGLEKLCRRFEQRAIRWCVLDDRPLPGPAGGTLRILIEPRDLDRAEHAVRATTGIVLAADTGGRSRAWLLRDPVSGSAVTVNVMTQLAGLVSEDLAPRLARGILLQRRGARIPRAGGPEQFWLSLLRLWQGDRQAMSLSRLQVEADDGQVTTSPLAAVVAEAFGTPVLLLLDDLRKGVLPPPPSHLLPWGQGPRLQDPAGLRARRRAAMTVAVVDPGGAAEALLEDPPPWPFPVEVVNGRLLEPGNRRSAAGVLMRLLALHGRLRRQRLRAPAGTLLVLAHHPYELLTGQGTRSRLLRPLVLALAPRPEAVAVVRAPGNGAAARSDRTPPLDALYHGPQFILDPLEGPAQLRAELGRGLWGLLSWRVATAGLKRWRRPPTAAHAPGPPPHRAFR